MNKLIVRENFTAEGKSFAIYSPCETYRYALERTWNDGAPKLLYIMLNPSTATELKNDPTIERCERRARTLGYGSFRACNLFAYRATDPRDLKRAKDPIGPDNLSQILQASRWADRILCAWGTHGAHLGLGLAIKSLLLSESHVLHHLGLSKEGHPRHPLYVGYRTAPEPWP
ncbi:hypothetical protein SAMN04515647_0791 [Cohaesibacter sp. ES.047]|uniref:DUF1643 domain-containing protein n=1 Tax=Cohaesibacter sp. ES.047 TaxID=1798205 RepID=UPI000BB8619E|nr:DUF1643 domain-containing protein [Cohaesibacter sp. ES.047]SNY90620.1 hypothetical protein SAMN04515647_0791 [Cohaesibacter sp. ES.047]